MRKTIAGALSVIFVLSSCTACSKSSSKNRSKGKADHSFRVQTLDTGSDPSVEPTESTPHATTESTTVALPTPTPTEPEINIRPNDNANVRWTTYTSDDGYFTIEAPEGWNVRYINYDVIGYEVYVENPSAEMFFYFATSFVSYPSKENCDYWKEVYKNYRIPVSEGYMFISPEASAQSLFENSSEYFGYNDFTLIDNLGPNGYGGDILKANVMFYGRQYEGIFTSSVIDTPMYYDVMDFDQATGTAYIMLPVEDFTDWIGIFLRIFGSLTFTESYYADRNLVWQQTMAVSQQIMYNADAISNMIMDSWEQSNRISDIQSQEYSDATLGRERVYDPASDEVYYCDSGWYDRHNGTDLQPVTSGSDYYLKPVTGTIY